MMNATAVTSVFWDICKCPVPADFDARRVGPCIKRFLEKSGYSGPLTIRAIGPLTDFPLELLRTLSSTGIFLHMTPDRPMCFQAAMFRLTNGDETPANIMVITDPTNRNCSSDLALLKGFGHKIILPYPFRPAECVWENFLRAESGALEAEDKCIGTGESAWLCTECFTPSGRLGVTGQGFESFSTHVSSQEHKESFCLPSEFIPKPAGSDEDDYYDEEYEYEEAVGAWSENSLPGATLCGYSPPAYATTMLMHQPKSGNSLPGAQLCGYSPLAYATTMVVVHQPKTWQFPPLFATPSEYPPYVTTMEMIQPKPHMFATPSEYPRYATTMEMIQPKPHMFATPSEYHGKGEPEGKRKRV